MRSDYNYKQHVLDVYKFFVTYGEKKASKFINFYKSRYDTFGRSFLNHKLAWLLYDDYIAVNKNLARAYGVVGDGGTGKTTLAMNIAYFLDTQFNIDSIKTDWDDIISKLNEFSSIKSMRSLVLDEPDLKKHSSSIKGKLIRSILGKARQQGVFIIYCATDMRDIEPYVFKKLTGLFFTSRKGEVMYFRNRPSKYVFPLNQIRYEYMRIGYDVFFKHKKSLGCLRTKTTKHLPLTDEAIQQYKDQKSTDYKQDITTYLNGNLLKTRNHARDSEIIEKIKKGGDKTKISEQYGVSKRRIDQIARDMGYKK